MGEKAIVSEAKLPMKRDPLIRRLQFTFYGTANAISEKTILAKK